MNETARKKKRGPEKAPSQKKQKWSGGKLSGIGQKVKKKVCKKKLRGGGEQGTGYVPAREKTRRGLQVPPGGTCPNTRKKRHPRTLKKTVAPKNVRSKFCPSYKRRAGLGG